MKRLLAKGGVVAMALTMALVGCAGGLGGTGTDDVSGAAQKEIQHWYQTSSRTQSVKEAGEEGSAGAYAISFDTTVTYEYDEHGNLLKQKRVTNTAYDEGSSVNEVTNEFTRDENGWPLTETVTDSSTSTFSYDDGTGKMVEDTSESGPFTNEITYSYEYDKQGRVVKASSSNESKSKLELAYDDEGNVVKCVRTDPVSEVDGIVQRTITTTEYDAKGTTTGKQVVTTDEFDNTLSSETYEYDEDGLVTKTVTTRPQDKGDDLVETRTYTYEKNADGTFAKQTVTVEGDGTSTNTRYTENGKKIREVLLADGSVKAQNVTVDEYGNEIPGEESTYQGPYSVVEQAFDDKGNQTSYRCTYYDGTVYSSESTYDDNGNLVSSSIAFADGSTAKYEYSCDKDGNVLSKKLVDATFPGGSTYRETSLEETNEWVYVEEPSQFTSLNARLLWWL